MKIKPTDEQINSIKDAARTAAKATVDAIKDTVETVSEKSFDAVKKVKQTYSSYNTKPMLDVLNDEYVNLRRQIQAKEMTLQSLKNSRSTDFVYRFQLEKELQQLNSKAMDVMRKYKDFERKQIEAQRAFDELNNFPRK